jgi:flagellar biosynthesis protein FlhA
MTKDPMVMTEHVRQALGRLISNMHKSRDGKLRALSIEKAFEEKLQASVQATAMGPELHVDPVTAKAFIERVARKLSDKTSPEGMPVVVCSQSLRPHLMHLLEKFISSVAVLSHAEVAGNIEVEFVDSVGEKD